MNQKIIAFHKDIEDHWVADLECGHKQHMRHEPPWMERHWILTQEGRQSRIGSELNCKRCDEMGKAIAEAVRSACIEIICTKYTPSESQTPAEKIRWEAVIEAIRSAELKSQIDSAIYKHIAAS